MSELFHYTDAYGLHGIISKKIIWANDSRFMNDPNEIYYGRDLFRQAAESYQGTDTNYIRNVLGYRDNKSLSGVFFSSFSKEGDLLSQWRGYNRGLGFSICFDDDLLTQAMSRSGLKRVEVIYDKTEQDKVVRDHFTSLPEHFISPEASRKAWKSMATPLATWEVLNSLKDHNYSEEREIRFMCYSWDENTYEARGGIKSRPTPRGFKPYLEVPLSEPGTNVFPMGLIKKIIVGPALPDAQIVGVGALLHENGVESPITNGVREDVVKSQIPYIAE